MDEHVLKDEKFEPYKKIAWSPSGVCAKMFFITILQDPLVMDRIEDIVIHGGCPGNAQAIIKLLKGMTIKDAIAKLEGIKCGNKSTSCPDQLAEALKAGKSNC